MTTNNVAYMFSKTARVLREIKLSRTDNAILGVCGGLGEASEIPSWLFRAAFLILAFYFGTGVLLYFILGLVLADFRELEVKEKEACDEIKEGLKEIIAAAKSDDQIENAANEICESIVACHKSAYSLEAAAKTLKEKQDKAA